MGGGQTKIQNPNSYPLCSTYRPLKEGTYFCPGDCHQAGTVWGTGTYHPDSCICRAAVHVGILPATGQGGAFSVRKSKGLENYKGTEVNGIESYNFGETKDAIIIGRAPGAPAPQ